MSQGIQTYKVGSTKSCTLWPGCCRTCNRIHFLHTQAQISHMLNTFKNGICTDSICNKVCGILCIDNPFSKPTGNKVRQSLHNPGISICAWNNLHQTHITGRIEKMSCKKILSYLSRKNLCHLIYRQTAGICGENCSRCQMRHELFQKIKFDWHIFNNNLNYPITLFQFSKIIFKVTDLYLSCKVREVKWSGFHFQQPFQTAFSNTIAYSRAVQG